MPNVVYTAFFIDKPFDLLQKIPVKLSGKNIQTYAHHITVEYMPLNEITNLRIGTKVTLLAYAQVCNESVQAVLVRSSNGSTVSTNAHPHVTIATANGAVPNDSNQLIADSIAHKTLQYITPSIEIHATLGYFDGQHVITML